MSSSSDENSSEAEEEVQEDDTVKQGIREELSSMSFEELMKLKEELGAKVYKEAVFGAKKDTKTTAKDKQLFKRLNKNRPREQSSKRQVPFLGNEPKTKKKQLEHRDPRFDEKAGTYDTKNFKANYKFLTKIRAKEIAQLKKQLLTVEDDEEKKRIKFSMQRLINKNAEEQKWHEKQYMLKEEQKEVEKAIAEGKTPHYVTKKERRAKELVKQFEKLKKDGSLSKHLEKKRKKNAAKDRKKFSFD